MRIASVRNCCGVAVTIAGICFLLGGCGGNLDSDNVGKVKFDMSQNEVEEILGKGEVDRDPAPIQGMNDQPEKTETWSEGNKKVMVAYVNNKVQLIVRKTN
jgi:hypothetical protein